MKNQLRRIMALAAALVMTAGIAGCGSAVAGNNQTVEMYNSPDSQSIQNTEAEESAADIRIAALKGPTAIGMVNIMKSASQGKTTDRYEFTIAGTADEFTADLIKGDVQIAALPCNAAATLYNKSGGKIQVMGINTLGVLYIVDTADSVRTIQDLKGRTIYSTGKGTTPEYTLRYLLQSAGINPDKDVTIEFKSEATEVAALIQQSRDEVIAMLPQPYVTTVMMQNSNVRIALDVTKEWEKLAGSESSVVTGVVAVNSEFAQKHPRAVARFMEEYKKSAAAAVSDVETTAELVGEFGIFKADVARKAIPYCNITLITADEMKTKITGYLKVLYEQNPASVGGNMPKDDFYYIIKP